MVASSPGPLIDSKRREWGGLWQGRGLHDSKQRSRWRGPWQAGSKARAGLSAESHTYGEQRLGQSQGPSRPRLSDIGQPFGENALLTGRKAAEKLAHANFQADLKSCPRQ